MAHTTSERPAWTIRKDDMVLGHGRVRESEQLPDTDVVCIVFYGGEFIVCNSEDPVSIMTTVKG